jgi:hypothetical protein
MEKVIIQTDSLELARNLITNEDIQDVLDETKATLEFEVTEGEEE